ncbi:zinc ABC transporter substrate-binding protein [Polymorphum gilvum]|uniref:High-affinity zinc uptake system protein ZnuA n=1 Tax=Polymorphum gilvum (strain LMG 25793 / CGMCC 1.9160 / SL003B-26A1) TaxID=991905 RepID=F2J571_POLGS|nr:zinc ABC transporter substrate-binding protein [Polymorphum gilvum]ADZ71130.1 Zinc ABC transporter, periplasmic zinc-binding protein [Polymorphum gilvum SL003B-26A1]
MKTLPSLRSALRSSALALVLAAGLAPSAGAGEAVAVAASIKPVHSLVAAVMDGVGAPGIIVDGAASPHTYALKPSTARVLEKAELIFWVGPRLETFLVKPLETLGAGARSIELGEAHDLTLLPVRAGGAFERHSHDDEDDDGDEHGHREAAQPHDTHAHGEAAKDHDGHAHADQESRDHGGHDHDGMDSHIWLDPMNAKAMVHEIEEALSEADPANAERYKANAEAVEARLDALTAEIAAELAPVKDRSFVVFHDAYQYFEARFGLAAAGSITVSPEVMPGAERVADLRAKIKDLKVACVFSEPQFQPKLVSVLVEGTQARAGVLDPLGADLADGPELYFDLIRGLAASVKDCLSGS